VDRIAEGIEGLMREALLSILKNSKNGCCAPADLGARSIRKNPTSNRRSTKIGARVQSNLKKPGLVQNNQKITVHLI
jgi:hypothetical protein